MKLRRLGESPSPFAKAAIIVFGVIAVAMFLLIVSGIRFAPEIMGDLDTHTYRQGGSL